MRTPRIQSVPSFLSPVNVATRAHSNTIAWYWPVVATPLIIGMRTRNPHKNLKLLLLGLIVVFFIGIEA